MINPSHTQLAFGWMLNDLKRVFAYRAEFWTWALGNVATQFGVAYFIWTALFTARNGEALAGISLNNMLGYALLAPLIERLVQGGEIGFISKDIYEGGLNKYLLFPRPYFLLKLASHAAGSLMVALQGIVLVAIAGLFLPGLDALSLTNIALAIPALVIGSFTYFIMSACLEMVAFWADNTWSLSFMLRLALVFLGGGIIPLSLFPNWLSGFLRYTPFPGLISDPLTMALGRMEMHAWVLGLSISIFYALAFSALAAWIWKIGLRKYNGVGI